MQIFFSDILDGEYKVITFDLHPVMSLRQMLLTKKMKRAFNSENVCMSPKHIYLYV